MIDVSEFKRKGRSKVKYERHGTGRAELQKMKSQISGFPQQKLSILTARFMRAGVYRFWLPGSMKGKGDG
jgi:hypothetical protein